MRAQLNAGQDDPEDPDDPWRDPGALPSSGAPSASAVWASLVSNRTVTAAVGGPGTRALLGERRWPRAGLSSRRLRFAVGVALALFVPASLPTNAAPGDPPNPIVTASPASGEVSAPEVINATTGAAGLAERIQVIASADGIELLASSAATRMVGYHQAGSRRALALHPRGVPRTNRNVGRYRAPAPTPGVDYAILWNRHRGTHPTSAVDVAMAPGHPVPSPVSGTVERVRPYALYGRHPDLMVTIVPDGAPDRRVVVMHLDVTTVRPGDRVVGGHTTIAKRARRLPFPSQIDSFAGPGSVHIHAEIRVR